MVFDIIELLKFFGIIEQIWH